MINRDKTLKQLNIDVSVLKRQSIVKVYWNCDSCGLEKIKPYRDCTNNTGLCRKCNSIKRGHEMGNNFGKVQQMQGQCLYCDTPIRSQHVTCVFHRKAHLKKIYSGSNNPAYVGRCDIKCTCGNKKSVKAKQCRQCSFESGQRSGSNNGRWIKDRGKLRSAKIARTVLSNTLKSLGLKKNGRTAKILGYTFNELKEHIEAQFEPWMNWSNYGIRSDQWSVDHIIPVAVLIKHNITDPSIINALWNLRPLETAVNIRRSNSVDEFAKSLASQKLNLNLYLDRENE